MAGSIPALNSCLLQVTEPPSLPKDCKPKPCPEVPHYCLPVFLAFKPAMQTGVYPFSCMHLWVSELPSSCSISFCLSVSLSFSLRVWGALPDHSRGSCMGSSIFEELPSSCLWLLFSVSVHCFQGEGEEAVQDPRAALHWIAAL